MKRKIGLFLFFVFLTSASLAQQPMSGRAFGDKSGSSSTLQIGLVAFWRLSENPAQDGTSIADSMGSNAGTLTTADGATNKSVVGQYGRAIDFDGVNDYIDVGAGSSLDLTTLNFTITAWIFPKGWGGGSRGRIVEKSMGTGTGYSFQVDNNTATAGLALGVNVAGTVGTDLAISENNIITLSQWQHVAVVASGSGNIAFYVNGTLKGTVNQLTPAPLSSAAVHMNIGNRSSDQLRQFFGSIEEVRIYNRVLKAWEILILSGI